MADAAAAPDAPDASGPATPRRASSLAAAVIGRHRRLLVVGFAAGALLGTLAWGDDRAPALACALPLAIVFSRSRLQAFAIACGYAAGVLRHAPAFIAAWFDGDLAVGLAAVTGCALATGTVWCLGWSGSTRFARRATSISAAWLLALPAGIAVPGHPLIAFGALWPGSGWAGCLLAWMLPALVIGASGLRLFHRVSVRRGACIATLAALAFAGIGLGDLPPPDLAGPVQALRTHWGPLASEDEALVRIERMAATAIPDATHTVVWPESIIGRHDRSLDPVLEAAVLRPARRTGRTEVIGMDLPLPGNRLLNAAVAFYPDGRSAVAVARQPAPLSLWKPWRRHDTFVADWTARNMLDLGPGFRVAVIFCFEEYMPLMVLLDEAFDAPTLYLVMANTWAARSPEAAVIQTRHSFGMARLFGRPYLKAENRPAP